ncbi:hypothetical protein CHL76_09280 [Marinococcus halophilus]|uniref:Uncharacterized protein n=1 Tax=Marinococcus halophilus TaxID=1371 RepID=A0A510Y6L5_MARHA|nr:hypothetical protein [Marinococcus halophilus]OZT80288.1 hypothetical protein CHL76_09280 [Marinococcus halophilus]GEK58351.1 hypothetical protein MHA01_12560 [Marinococcus halophilus]
MSFHNSIGKNIRIALADIAKEDKVLNLILPPKSMEKFIIVKIDSIDEMGVWIEHEIEAELDENDDGEKLLQTQREKKFVRAKFLIKWHYIEGAYAPLDDDVNSKMKFLR